MEKNIPDVREVKRKKEKAKRKRNYGRTLLIISIAFAVGAIHYFYVSYLFENDRNFSMLSELEREMSLRTEMGFYYSYYKTIVTEKPFLAGITKLMYDRQVEYPNTVNAFNRFNIHPEMLLGSIYRYIEPWINSTVSCQTVYRGDHLSQVESCQGIGWPIYFYLEGIWTLAGLTVAALFLSATALSNSILGGLFTVAQYFANHPDATRVMWAPNERESFAQPLLLVQMWLVTLQLRGGEGRRTSQIQIAVFLVNCFCLLSWQFTQFIFLTQMAIFFVMEQLKIIDLKTFCIFLHAHFCGLHMAVLLLQGNDMLKSSLYTSFFIIMSIYCLMLSTLRIKVISRFDLLVESWLILLRIGIFITASFSLKKAISDFLEVEEDNHIWEIFFSKIFDTHNFHSLLYVCSDVFDFLPRKTWIKLISTTLLPITVICIVNSVIQWYQTGLGIKVKEVKNKKAKSSDTESDNDSGIENNAPDKNVEDKILTKEMNNRKSKMDGVAIKNDLDEIEEKIKTTNDGSSEKELNNETTNKDPLIEFLRNMRIDPGVFYNISQMVVFGVMATLVMRLKLLFVPHMCIISGLIGNSSFPESRPSVRRARKFVLGLLGLLFLRSIPAVFVEEVSLLGEFEDQPQEELVTWINSFTTQQAVFAGPMPLMATILLTTRRAIVNHPHYEHKEARDRTYAVYKSYGKFSAQELYQELTRLRVTYLVLDKQFCYGKSNKGCTFEYIWDVQSPELAHKARLCVTLLKEHVDHFYRVFQNQRYSVYKVHDYSVRYMPRTFDT